MEARLTRFIRPDSSKNFFASEISWEKSDIVLFSFLHLAIADTKLTVKKYNFT